MKTIEFEELKNIVFDIYGFKNIDENTCINCKKTVSEDNDKLIKTLESKYSLCMDNFNYYDYFDEDEFIMFTILKSFLSAFGFKTRKKKKLTLNKILKIIKKGKWFDDE